MIALTPSADFAERLELFFGAASESLCRVYARMDLAADEAGLDLSGTLTGPNCHYTPTLPATFFFRDKGPGPSLLAEAIVPEPSFWTPEMPHWYRATLQLRKNGELVAEQTRMFAIRPLGASGQKLLYGGQSWVLRGVRSDEVPETPLETWRSADSAMAVRQPDDALCESASRLGVLLIAELADTNLPEIRRLARWPAVAMIVLDRPVDQAKVHAPNVLLAERFFIGQPSDQQPWADLAIGTISNGQRLELARQANSRPLIVTRSAGRLGSVAEGRAACDCLQSDLAGNGNLAGYLV